MTDTTARAALIAYAATTRTVTVDGLDPLIDAVIAEAAPSAAVSPPPATDRAGLRGVLADAIRAAACPGDACPLSEVECAEQRIQPGVWERGVLAEVSGRPEWFADAVLSVLPPDGRASGLRGVNPQTLTAIAAHVDARSVAILRPDSEAYAGWQAVAAELRRLAAGERDEQQAQQGGVEVLPPPEGPEYIPCACGHIEPEYRRQRPGWTREACYGCPCVDYAPVVQQPDPPEAAEEPSPEETVRGHVLALHQVGEQLAVIEAWMWEHLADTRDAAAPVAGQPPADTGEEAQS